MNIILVLTKQNVIMFIYLFIGYFLFRKKLVGVKGSADIGRMVLYIVLPLAIVKSYLVDFSMEMLEGLAVSFLAALLSLILAIVTGRLCFKKADGIERFGAAFSNAGFIGIPLVQMTLGADAVFYVASFVALLNIFQWTYGVIVMAGDRSSITFAKIRTNPIVISFIVGIVLFFIPVTLPGIVTDVIGTVAAMNGPLAMIVLGTYLAQVPVKSIFTDKKVYKCTVVRLLLIPALTVVLLMFFPSKYYLLKMTVLIAAAAPVGSNVAIFAQLYDKDYTQAVKEVCMSTLLCIATMPVIIGVANLIY